MTEGFVFHRTSDTTSSPSPKRTGGGLGGIKAGLRQVASVVDDVQKVGSLASASKPESFVGKVTAVLGLAGGVAAMATPLLGKFFEWGQRQAEEQTKRREASADRLERMMKKPSPERTFKPNAKLCNADTCFEAEMNLDRRGRLVARKLDGTIYERCGTTVDGERFCEIGGQRFSDKGEGGVLKN